MGNTLTTVCKICGSSKVKLVMVQKEGNYTKCKNCGTVFAHQSSELVQSLPEVYENWEDTRAFYKKDVFEAYKPILKKRVELLKKYVKEGNLLDIGCGAGYFLYMARKMGFQVDGLDLNPYAAKWAKTFLKLPIRTGRFEDIYLKPKSFDAIYIFNVLEHLADPNIIIGKSNSLLKKNGVISISVPNADGLVYMVKNLCYRILFIKKYSTPVTLPHHLYGFTPKALHILLEKKGFQVLNLFTVHAGERTYSPYTWRRKITIKRVFDDFIDGVVGKFLSKGQFIILYAQKIKDI